MDSLATVQPSGGMLNRSDIDELNQIFDLAKRLYDARDFIPAHFKSPNAVAAAIIAGRELGLPAMLSLRSLYVIGGKVGLDAALQLALIKRAGVRHTWLADGSDRRRARIKLERAGDAPFELSFTIEEADNAGLLRNPTWKAHTAAMLRARAVSAAVRAFCPDVLAGVYVADELTEMDTPRPIVVVNDAPPHDAVTGEVVEAVIEKPDPVADLIKTLPECNTTDSSAEWFKKLEALDYPPKKKRKAYDAWGVHVKALFKLEAAHFAELIRNPPAEQPPLEEEIP